MYIALELAFWVVAAVKFAMIWFGPDHWKTGVPCCALWLGKAVLKSVAKVVVPGSEVPALGLTRGATSAGGGGSNTAGSGSMLVIP